MWAEFHRSLRNLTHYILLMEKSPPGIICDVMLVPWNMWLLSPPPAIKSLGSTRLCSKTNKNQQPAIESCRWTFIRDEQRQEVKSTDRLDWLKQKHESHLHIKAESKTDFINLITFSFPLVVLMCSYEQLGVEVNVQMWQNTRMYSLF